MGSLMIRDLPDDLHRKLKMRAKKHHRSMNREAIAILQAVLREEEAVREVPPPYRGSVSLTRELIEKAKEDGRP